MRKAKRSVAFDDILSSNFYAPDTNTLIDPILRGHLILEAIIVEIIQQSKAGDTAWNWNFPTKTKYLVDQNLISDEIKLAFDEINNLRNDFAHSFGFDVTPNYLLELARKLEDECGVDFSDSIGHYSVEEALEYYESINGILSEILWCVLFEAANVLEENGGRDIF
jgi:hypothetical protein